jgi:MoxR-like ATPase
MRVGSLSLLRPIFSNIILADEINRTPPKTQAALLEAMQERSVTIAGENHQLDLPYFVLASKPNEQEGTYPLPEAQLDRFMFAIKLEYPSLKRKFKLLKERPLLRQQLLICLNLRKLSIFSS